MRPSNLKPDNRISAISVPNTRPPSAESAGQRQRERHAVEEEVAQRAADDVEIEIAEHGGLHFPVM